MSVNDREIDEARRHLLAWLTYHMDVDHLDRQTLAKKVGVTKGLVTQWFNGAGTKGLPSFASLLAIAKEVNVTLDILTRVSPPRR